METTVIQTIIGDRLRDVLSPAPGPHPPAKRRAPQRIATHRDSPRRFAAQHVSPPHAASQRKGE